MPFTKRNRILLVLDLDETLVFSSEAPLAHVQADHRTCGYYVHRRPGLENFLVAVKEHFDLAFWSAAGTDYVCRLVPDLLYGLSIEPVFVWSAPRCTRRYDPETQEVYYIKDFNKLRRRGLDLRRALIVDDLERNCQRNYGNAIYIKSFEGDQNDRELYRLASYLVTIKDLDNVRSVEKRDWVEATPLPDK